MKENNLEKRFFGYSKYNAGVYPVLIYDSLPTNSHNGKPRSDLLQMVEVPSEHLDKKIDELATIYPYKGNEDEEKS